MMSEPLAPVGTGRNANGARRYRSEPEAWTPNARAQPCCSRTWL